MDTHISVNQRDHAAAQWLGNFQKAPQTTRQVNLTVIVPTRNEAGNVQLLLRRIEAAMAGMPIEVLFVDDSRDNTPQVVREQMGKFSSIQVNLLHRPEGQRTGGLSGAVVAGMRVAKGDWVCVIDGDLQHPPEVIPQMLQAALDRQVDLVVASRRTQESDMQFSLGRNLISLGLDKIAHGMFPNALSGVSDPLAGFFLVRRTLVDLDSMHPKGFKILLEILVRHPQLKKSEVSFHFAARHSGESKAGMQEAVNYFNLLASLRFGENWLSVFKFGLVGLTGILVNLLTMAAFTDLLGVYYLISAVIATLTSTTWNFLLTETWVFGGRSRSSGWAKRFVLFFLLNNAALLLRTPILYGLTDLAGLHYLISNFISLAVVFVARYFLADQWIWGKGANKASNIPAPAPVQAKAESYRRKTVTTIYYYSIHGIITAASEVILPELTPFQVEQPIERPTMRVLIGKPSRTMRPELRAEDSTMRHTYYSEIFGRLGFQAEINVGKRIEIVASPLLRYSPHVLYTNVVEPVLRWAFVERGFALVHGATIAYDNRAYMITARTDTGKTTTLLKILNQQRRGSDKAAFISDDMTLLGQDGQVLTYPKPLTISHHTVRAVNPEVLTTKERLALLIQSRIHSRSGRKIAFWMRNSNLPMATINAIVQWIVPPPKYAVDRLVPNVKFAQSLCLAGLFVIERGVEAEATIEQNEAVEVLLSNCEDAYGFPPYESIKEFLYLSNGVDLRVAEQKIIRSVFELLPATLVRSSNLAWWRHIPHYVDQEMGQFFLEKPAGEGRSAERADNLALAP